jgi:hypothetical protein
MAIILTVALVLGLSSTASAVETTTVSVSPSRQPAEPGGTFTVSIVIDPGTAIAGVQFDLTFDPSLVTVDSVEEGGLLRQDGASTYFTPGVLDNEAGVIRSVVGVITTPEQTVSASGAFALIVLTASTREGTCSLTLSNVVIGDADGQSVPVSLVNGEVAVNVNRAPILGSIGDKMVSEGELLEFTISAVDPDGDSLSYSGSGLPKGATFSPSTRTFSWTPRYNQSGTYPGICFKVSDDGLTDSENVAVIVRDAERGARFNLKAKRKGPKK